MWDFIAHSPWTKRPKRMTSGAAAYDAFADIREREIQIRTPKNQLYLKRVSTSLFDGSQDDHWRLTLPPKHRALIPLGFSYHLPWGIAGLLFPRSGLAWKQDIVLANAIGLVDSDYRYIDAEKRNEWMALIKNESDEPFEIVQGERVCQILIVHHGAAFGFEESDTVREGGFGHTGTK